jgi:hypothetical protein
MTGWALAGRRSFGRLTSQHDPRQAIQQESNQKGVFITEGQGRTIEFTE